MSTGELIKMRRRTLGYTQQQLGEALGYKGRTAELTIQHIENNRREVSLKTLRKLSEILRVPVEDLIP